MLGRWVAKLIARLLAKAALWVRIQTSLENAKWKGIQKEWQHILVSQISTQNIGDLHNMCLLISRHVKYCAASKIQYL
jgi:hypothetical protein